VGNSNAQRGTYLERVAMDRLVDAGYCVLRSAGSHGIADLIAVKPGVVLLVQSKIRASLLGSREWQELWDLSVRAGALPILAHRPTPRTVAFARLLGPRRLHEKMAGLLEEYHP
jgi:Holliday junction resolvase